MWKLQRHPLSPTSTAVSGHDDTLCELGDLLGLGEDAWADRVALTSDGRPLPLEELSPRELLPAGMRLEVPNTVYLLWEGDCGPLGRLAVGWSSERRTLTSLGFHVREIVHGRPRSWAQPEEIIWRLADAARQFQLHGLCYTGHGLPYGLGPRSVWCLRYVDLREEALTYRLPLVLLNCCHGGWSLHDTNGPELGGRDLLSDSPGALFHGVKHVLWPRLFCFPGHAKRVSDLITPGQQGTLSTGLMNF